MSYKLSNDGAYSPRERLVFMLLPKDGRRINTVQLVSQYYRNRKRSAHPNPNMVSAVRSLQVKVNKNREPFRIMRSKRAGPHPLEYWVEGR